MLKRLEKFLPKSGANVDALVAKLTAQLTEAEAAAHDARSRQTDTLLEFHEGTATDAALEATRETLEKAEHRVAEVRASLRGAEERRAALVLAEESTVVVREAAALRVKRDEALALADDTDRIAQAVHVSLGKFVEQRNELVTKRAALAAMVRNELGGADDLDGLALATVAFDSQIKVDLGGMGLAAFGPPFTDPTASRAPTIAERVLGGSAALRRLLDARFPS